ncbi:hypothetical protein VCUG_01460 [Vavraia culicis subsp. floridensis]|uniref:Uncharacterized protein n=1 Tax=Vavraia culicis (isolate floridensis) TaxID=948595 RepID=L2GV97_VAVCU|nr:uncharacterized protein VCUG_01460 [Vavraia culicis subsp. floridensis]ELA47015.1 hypothetical protein VCUG_01460 [Vavraia culicis subsp. floridensis]
MAMTADLLDRNISQTSYISLPVIQFHIKWPILALNKSLMALPNHINWMHQSNADVMAHSKSAPVTKRQMRHFLRADARIFFKDTPKVGTDVFRQYVVYSYTL